jgi:hypothetical protein
VGALAALVIQGALQMASELRAARLRQRTVTGSRMPQRVQLWRALQEKDEVRHHGGRIVPLRPAGAFLEG